MTAHGVEVKGKCVSCGRPTTDYRCKQCWEKIRKGQGKYSIEVVAGDTGRSIHHRKES